MFKCAPTITLKLYKEKSFSKTSFQLRMASENNRNRAEMKQCKKTTRPAEIRIRCIW